MRLPDPIANTTTEAYLAYKAGVLAEGDLKPKLYEPYIHLDAWLAYWTGLTTTYPVKSVGKNLFDKEHYNMEKLYIDSGGVLRTGEPEIVYIPCQPNTTYTVSKTNAGSNPRFAVFDTAVVPAVGVSVLSYVGTKSGEDTATSYTITTSNNAEYLGVFYRTNTTEKTTEQILATLQIEKGSTATAYEPYTGEPEMLTDEEAYIAYLSGVTDTYPEEFKDPADIRVAAYLRYLISARFDRPEYPVTNEELYLSMQKPPYIPSGEPSSDIVIDGTIKAPFIDVKMYGDTSQKSYEGKNLLHIIPIGTAQGITGTVNQDGEVTVSGTCTTTYANLTARSDVVSFPAGTYTLSLTKPHANFGVRLRCYDQESGGTYTDYQVDKNSTSKTFTTSSETKSGYVWLSGTAQDVVIDDTFGIQLESGSTATTFEKFVGGTPSPSPEYPQPIQTVTGEQMVKVVGKNLFKSIPTGSNNGINFTLNSDGTYDIDGQSTAQANKSVYITDLSELTDGSTYSLSATKALPNGVQVMCEVFNGTATWVRHALGTDGFLNSSRQSITGQLNLSGGDRLKLTLRVQNGTTVNLENLGVQLELGSTATDYEPYSSNDYEINLGKNLFDPSLNPTHVSSHQSLVKNETGMTVTAALENSASNWSEFVEYTYSLDPNTTYTLSKKSRVISGAQYRHSGALRVHNIGDGTYGPTTDADTITFTTDRTGKVGILFYLSYLDTTQGAVSTSVEFYDVQLEAGESQTPFSEYFEPIELCKLGAYQDYIWKDGEEWKVHKATKKLALDGSEDWKYYNTVCQLYSITDYAISGNTPYCGAFKGVSNVEGLASVADNTCCFINVSGQTTPRFYVRYSDKFTSADSIKSYLTSNPTTLYYALATQTDTTITNQALIDQLDALSKGGSEEGITYIKLSASDPNLPGLLYVEAATED